MDTIYVAGIATDVCARWTLDTIKPFSVITATASNTIFKRISDAQYSVALSWQLMRMLMRPCG